MPSRYLSNRMLRNVLNDANEEEKLCLTQIFDKDETVPYSPEVIQEKICIKGGHSVMNLLRNQGLSYLEILNDVAKKLKISEITPYYGGSVEKPSLSDFDSLNELKFSEEKAIEMGEKYAKQVENKIVVELLKVAYEKMTPEQKKEFDDKMQELASQYGSNSGKKLSGIAGVMMLGELGGFATFILLTKTMSILSFGLLSFGAYTTATSLLGVILGPVGWSALGLTALYKLGKPDYKKVIPLVISVGLVRQRIYNDNIAN